MVRNVKNLSFACYAIFHLVTLSGSCFSTKDIVCYETKEIGEQKPFSGFDMVDDIFRYSKVSRKSRAKLMPIISNTANINDSESEANSTRLLQRIIHAVLSNCSVKNCFSYELSLAPLALFYENGFMRKTIKSSVYEILDSVEERYTNFKNVEFVIDGGHLIYRVTWPKNGTFALLYLTYIRYIWKFYGRKCTVVFDGYMFNGTKSIERQRRLNIENISLSREIFFDKTSRICNKYNLLGNYNNKVRLISQLAEALRRYNIRTVIAADDADLLIVHTAIEKSRKWKTAVIVGQDTDLLVLAIALSPVSYDIKFLKEESGNYYRRIYSSRDLQSSDILKNCKETILFAHAVSGCDTTSAISMKGKIQTFKVLNMRGDLQDVVSVFNNKEASHEEIAAAGERFILALYEAPNEERSLNNYRFCIFEKLFGKAHNNTLLMKLPPTSASARQHSYRVYYQIQMWRNNSLDPIDWGFKNVNNLLEPVTTTEAPAPEGILCMLC